MHTICGIPKENVFLCESEERQNNWNLTSKMEFSKLGMFDTKTFHTRDIVAKKYYKVLVQIVIDSYLIFSRINRGSVLSYLTF